MRFLLHTYLAIAGLGLLFVGFQGADPISVTVASLALSLTTIHYFGYSGRDEESIKWITGNEAKTPFQNSMLKDESFLEPKPDTSAPTPQETPALAEIAPLNAQDLIRPQGEPENQAFTFVEKRDRGHTLSDFEELDSYISRSQKDQRKRLILTRTWLDNRGLSFHKVTSGLQRLEEILYPNIYPNTDMISCVDLPRDLDRGLVSRFLVSLENYDEVVFLFPNEERVFWESLPQQHQDLDLEKPHDHGGVST